MSDTDDNQTHVPSKNILNSKLPMEIYFSIFLYLPFQEICKTRLVCQYWRDLADHDTIWRSMSIARWGSISQTTSRWKELYKEYHLNEIRQLKASCTMHVQLIPLKKRGNDKPVKVMIVGDGGVGKTCMIYTFSNKVFPEDEYIPTICGNYDPTIKVDEVALTVQIWDTAGIAFFDSFTRVGQPEYDQLRPLGYPQTNISLILFSVMDRDSFDNVTKRWVPELRFHCPKVPILLVGTKIDLRADEKMKKGIAEKGKPMVTRNEGLKVSKDIGALGYFEISAMKLSGVDDVIFHAARIGAGGFANGKEKEKKSGDNSKNCIVQ
jgi:Ras-related C3 botulinum toxin substrate 1